MLKKSALLFLACLTLLPSCLHAQVSQAAIGDKPHVWAGGEYSFYKPDYGSKRLEGVTIFGDVNVHGRYGLEGEARFLPLGGYSGLSQKNYLGGPYATLYHYGNFSANVKFLVGAGLITFPDKIGYGSYFIYVPGGDIDYRFGRRWKARFGYEYQLWPSAPGNEITAPRASHGLTPSGFNVGIAYRVF